MTCVLELAKITKKSLMVMKTIFVKLPHSASKQYEVRSEIDKKKLLFLYLSNMTVTIFN